MPRPSGSSSLIRASFATSRGSTSDSVSAANSPCRIDSDSGIVRIASSVTVTNKL